MKLAAGMSRFVVFWYFRISRRALVPGLKRWGFRCFDVPWASIIKIRTFNLWYNMNFVTHYGGYQIWEKLTWCGLSSSFSCPSSSMCLLLKKKNANRISDLFTVIMLKNEQRTNKNGKFRFLGGRGRRCLSPYHFVIARCYKFLSSIFKPRCFEGFFRILSSMSWNSTYCFVDDLMVFCKDTRNSVFSIQRVLEGFHSISGLQLHSSRSKICSSGLSIEDISAINLLLISK